MVLAVSAMVAGAVKVVAGTERATVGRAETVMIVDGVVVAVPLLPIAFAVMA